MMYGRNSSGYIKRRKKERKVKIVLISVIAVLVVAAAVLGAVKLKGLQSANTSAEEQPTQEVSGDIAAEEQPAEEQSAENVPEQSEQAAEPTPEPTYEPDLLKAVNNKDGIKTAYLTFDDGPTNSITPQILDILRRYNIKATFFMVGSLIESNGDMARRVFEEGHCLANHSHGHEYRELYENADTFMAEVENTNSLIRGVTLDENYPKIFRFPGGSYNAGTWGAQKQEYKSLLDAQGYRYCDWNCLNGDAEGGKKNAEQLLQGVITSSEGREDIVVLMHDAATKQTTADALPSVIEYLISQGYEFKTLNEVQ